MILLLALAPALAAEVTDMPPALRGDIDVQYRGSFGFAGLEEGGEIYGRRRVFRHDVTYGLEFAPIDGLAFNLAIPHTVDLRYGFSEANQMTWDPVTESGTYTAGVPLRDSPTLVGRGVTGVWIGVAAAPFAERFRRNQQVTWRLDAAFRTRASRSLWEPNDAGIRGAAKGGGAFKLAGAFSHDHGSTNPYLTAGFVYETRRFVQIEASNGPVDIDVRPAADVDVRGGIELVIADNDEKLSRSAFDLSLGFGYRSWEDIVSGVYLPDVLDVSRTIAVTSDDFVHVSAGVALDVRVNEYFGFRISGEGRYATPHRLEHVYPVRTSLDSVDIVAGIQLAGHIR